MNRAAYNYLQDRAAAAQLHALDGSSLAGFTTAQLQQAQAGLRDALRLARCQIADARAGHRRGLAGYYARQVAAYHRAALAVQRQLSTTTEEQ